MNKVHLRSQTKNKRWRENLVSRVARAVIENENNTQAFSLGGVEGVEWEQALDLFLLLCFVMYWHQGKVSIQILQDEAFILIYSWSLYIEMQKILPLFSKNTSYKLKCEFQNSTSFNLKIVANSDPHPK